MTETASSKVPFVPSLLTYHPGEKHRYVSLPPVSLTGNIRRVIRWCSTPDSSTLDPLKTSEEALRYAKQHETHLSVLEAGGITIPKHATLIGEHPERAGMLAIYHVVEHIEGAELDTNSPPDALRTLGKALLEYSNWVQDTNQPQFLSDIGTTHQYIVGQHHNPVLLDIEPGYFDTIDKHTGKTEILLDLMRSDAQVYAEL